MKAIELIGLSKTFRTPWRKPVEALKQVSLEVAEGEAFGFIGPNGAGKSTTIKLLTGALRPGDGVARLFGVDVALPQARRGLGYVPESPYLYDYLTPYEVLEMGIALHGLKVGDVRKHCLAWLERFDIAHVAHRQIRGFSKGMTQRTVLAHALAIQPRLLILDEPLSGLDPIGRRDVVDILMEFRHQGGTIFLTSHVLHDVERLADRFGLIHLGELRTVKSPAELVEGGGRMVIRTQGEHPIEGMAQDVGARWHVEIDPSELWQWMEKIRAAGHKLVEARPSLSLEQAFLTAVGSPEAPR